MPPENKSKGSKNRLSALFGSGKARDQKTEPQKEEIEIAKTEPEKKEIEIAKSNLEACQRVAAEDPIRVRKADHKRNNGGPGGHANISG